MGYQSRKRNYTSRRERYDRHSRNARLIILFAVLALLILLFLRRQDWLPYLETFFY